jgi:hypothetical protein
MTGATGGFSWTDRSGGVPDADDTAGALLALRHVDPPAIRRRDLGATWPGLPIRTESHLPPGVGPPAFDRLP